MITDRDLALLCAATYDPGVAWAFAGPTFHATLTTLPDGVMVIACEGSRSLADWIEDFDVVGPASFDHPALGVVHAGFDATTEECFPEVLARVGNLPIAVTGHSKGGANAEVLAAKLNLRGARVTSCVTFGTPRWVLGDDNVRVPRFLPASLGRSYRHFRDVVTEVPFPPWSHPATRPAVIIGSGTARDLLDVPGMHHIAGYVAALSP